MKEDRDLRRRWLLWYTRMEKRSPGFMGRVNARWELLQGLSD